jgi:parallel beta-helix repeat protein
MSSNNTIVLNRLIAINWLSIYLVYSSNNTLTENTIREGDYGINAMHSNGNRIYRNNFIDNEVQQYQVNSVNEWNDDAEGNYWSDYFGVDLNEDGVGDTMLPHSGVDYYPLVHIYDRTPPMADAGGNQTVFKNSAVFLDASGSSDNIDLASYMWDFGDGSSGVGINVNHTYTASGVYTVTLTVTDTAGNAAQNTVLIAVVDPPFPFIWWAPFAILGAVATILLGVFLLRRSSGTRGIKNKSRVASFYTRAKS